jgi:hypothetical protein
MEREDIVAVGKNARKVAGIKKTKIKILALQQIRWKSSGEITKGSYTLFYCCRQEQMGHYGTGFLVMKELMGSILGFEQFNERICKIRIKGKYHNIRIVNMHAPTEAKDNGTKEVFCEDLQKIMDRIPKDDILLVMEIFMLKLGKRAEINRSLENIKCMKVQMIMAN